MPDAIAIAKGVIELGFAASAVISVFVMLWAGYYKLIPAVTVLTAATNQLIETIKNQNDTCGASHEYLKTNLAKATEMLCSHSSHAEDMYITCREYSHILRDLNERLSRIEGRLGG